VNRSALILLLGCGLLVGGCSDGKVAPAGEKGGEPAGDRIAVPYPDLGAFDASVRNQLEEGRRTLEAVIDRANASDLESGRAFGRAGMVYQAYSLRDAALACYRNAAALDPSEFRWAYYLGMLLHESGESEPAAAELRRALDIRPDYVPAMIELGRVHYEQNRLDEAEALYRSSIELGGETAAALLELGKVSSSRREYAKAVERLEAARRLAPEATEIHYPLGVAYRGTGNLEKAEEFLTQRGSVRAEVADPAMNEVRLLARGVQFYLGRGNGYFQEGQYASARAEFEQAVAADATDPAAHANLGITLAMLDDPVGARRELETAVGLDDGSVVAHYNLGTLLAQRGDDPAAAEHFEATIREEPDHLQARINLANALRRLARFESSLPHYRRVVEGDPGNRTARLNEALTLVRLHRYVEARTRLEQAREAFPEDPAILNALARVLAAAPDDAARDRQEAIEIGRRIANEQLSLDSVVTLAMIAADNGEFEPAVRLQRQAVEWARSLDRQSSLRSLEADLRRYEQARPSRTPWPDDDPAVSPPPLNER